MPAAVRVLHFSDIHVQVDYRNYPLRELGWRRSIAQIEFRLLKRANKFRRAAETVRQIVADAERLKVDHAILSGDLTGLGMDEEFRAARQALGPLAAPGRLTVVPGNHDRYTPADAQAFEKHFADLCDGDLPEYRNSGLYPYVRLVGNDLAVIGLNTARLAPAPGLVFGTVGAAQRTAVAKILEDHRLAGRAVLAVVHHAPRNRKGKPDLITHRLTDANDLLRMLPGPRYAVLFGHLHERYWHRATADRPHLIGAGSSTQAGVTGYWLIDIQNGQVSGATAVSLE
jgi:3',5'-cyclic AMP phosphodiesterase CpdA